MPSLTIAVCIPTTGRPAVLTETLREVAGQTRQPDRVMVCPAKPDDVDMAALISLPLDVEIVTGGKGASTQRNTLLRSAGAIDVVLFLDDDFLMAPTYVAEMVRLFETEPCCVVATGRVLADGAKGRGYSVAEGRTILAGFTELTEQPAKVEPTFSAYGCNMAVRWSALHDKGCWFDEALPLYSWAEDVDFSRQAAGLGTVMKNGRMVGVHLAAKSGRVSGFRFGYSQIANQLYLARKGTISISGALRKVAENVAANAVGSIHNKGVVDRRGRLAGNLYGIRDILIGRSHPQRILDF